MQGLRSEELDFMLSPEGQHIIAAAKRSHHHRESWKGPDAAPWTEAHAAMAVRTGYLEYERARLANAEFAAAQAHRKGEETALRHVRNEALSARTKGANNGDA